MRIALPLFDDVQFLADARYDSRPSEAAPLALSSSTSVQQPTVVLASPDERGHAALINISFDSTVCDAPP